MGESGIKLGRRLEEVKERLIAKDLEV